MALTQTDPSCRNYKVAVIVGVIAGMVGAIVKFGWEVPLPPRTPERAVTNPPQAFLELLGFSDNFVHSSYAYDGNDGLPWVSFIVHFGFSIFFAVLYTVLAERFPQVKLWQGAAFGVAIWIAFHVVIMPLMGVVPAPWDQPFEEHFSELFGHAVWMWAIEIFRRDLRNHITHEPDAEFALDTRTVCDLRTGRPRGGPALPLRGRADHSARPLRRGPLTSALEVRSLLPSRSAQLGPRSPSSRGVRLSRACALVLTSPPGQVRGRPRTMTT